MKIIENFNFAHVKDYMESSYANDLITTTLDAPKGK